MSFVSDLRTQTLAAVPFWGITFGPATMTTHGECSTSYVAMAISFVGLERSLILLNARMVGCSTFTLELYDSYARLLSVVTDA